MKGGLIKAWKEYRGFAVFIVLMLIFRSALADWNVVPTGSMKPTIVEGDRILVNKLAYDFKVNAERRLLPSRARGWLRRS